jgi:hypothetical protein
MAIKQMIRAMTLLIGFLEKTTNSPLITMMAERK